MLGWRENLNQYMCCNMYWAKGERALITGFLNYNYKLPYFINQDRVSTSSKKNVTTFCFYQICLTTVVPPSIRQLFENSDRTLEKTYYFFEISLIQKRKLYCSLFESKLVKKINWFSHYVQILLVIYVWPYVIEMYLYIFT